MVTSRLFRFIRCLNFSTLRQLIKQIGKHRLPGLASEIAYNSMLAMFPAILAILTAIGYLENSQATFTELVTKLAPLVPTEVLTLIQNFIQDLSEVRNNQQLFSLSFVASLWVASGAVSAAMNALDQIHYADNKKLRPFWRAKLVSLGLTIGVLVLIIVASMLIFISDLIVQVLADRGGALESEILKSRRVESGLLRIWRLLRWPLALGIMAAAFGFIYRYGTHRRQRGFPIFPGAMTAALLWAVLSGLFRAYVSNFGNYNRTYGAIGAVIVLLLWLYLTALVMLIGEQLNVVVGEAWHRRSLTSAQGTQDRRH